MITLYQKNKPIWNYILLFSFSILFYSCEDVIEVDVKPGDNRLVIDAEILWNTENSGNTQHIYVSRLTNYYETKTTKVSHAEVQISNTTGEVFNFIETEEAGTYQCNDFIPKLGESYQLEVLVDQEVYTASETLVSTPEIIRIEQGAKGGLAEDQYEVIFYFNDPIEEENYYLEDFQTDFLIYPEYGISKDEFFNGNEIDFSFSNEDLEVGNTVNTRFRGISEQFYHYMSLILESYGANPFGTPPANIRGNIINKTNEDNYALGYFRLSQVREFSYTIEE